MPAVTTNTTVTDTDTKIFLQMCSINCVNGMKTGSAGVKQQPRLGRV